MLNELYRGLFALLVLFAGACLEEYLPKPAGVALPFLMMSALELSASRPLVVAVLLALGAGAVEDAILSLPMMSGASFFLIVVLAMRRIELRSVVVSALACPLYQMWLALWSIGAGGGVFWRILLSVPIGLVTAAAVRMVVGWLQGKAAVNEPM